MKSEVKTDDSDLVLMTGDIVSAMASRGNLSASQVPGLITTVHETLARLRNPPASAPSAADMGASEGSGLDPQVDHAGLHHLP